MQAASRVRTFASVAPVTRASRSHKVVVVGGGSAGLSVSHQLLRSGRFVQGDIAVVDPASWHHYQPGWTLVGGGLKTMEELRRPMGSLMDPKLSYYKSGVNSFSPTTDSITLGDGQTIDYQHLVVVPGIHINYGAIKGLSEALNDPRSAVSTIYGHDQCSKVFGTIQRLRKGVAIFTQPAGVVKCAGAPQKIMWLGLDYWRRVGLYNPDRPDTSPIKISFATGLAGMFGVPKYSAELDRLRRDRHVEGLFEQDLVAVEGDTAVFAVPDSTSRVTKRFDLLHVVPKMGPHEFVKSSPLANEAGYVSVDDATTQHKDYSNVWSIGDASSLPTSKTAAAITSQAPVLVRNLLRVMEGKEADATYNGYTSCPLLTEYGKVMLAEFKYGGEPSETFNWLGIDQKVPRRAFYYMKKDFFPWVYYKSMVKGTWGGASGWLN
ncbi:sulfide quinone reductase [Coniochaeta ligniaria NRRL 30616]|uniref:Sulfide quinone reductase n=1 Tax=Coniochaeta ligniaria NRRL 30616 TaxID=1408157 RepID=A0A1J7I5L2_9PEZI|nr:sulfide quinone reductase [Coniochaeta ligniaria NRRL 30616]